MKEKAQKSEGTVFYRYWEKGRVTAAIKIDKDGYRVAFSYRDNNDQNLKLRGRDIASSRLEKESSSLFVPKGDVLKYESLWGAIAKNFSSKFEDSIVEMVKAALKEKLAGDLHEATKLAYEFFFENDDASSRKKTLGPVLGTVPFWFLDKMRRTAKRFE